MDVGSLVVTLSVQANQFINEMKNAERQMEESANKIVSLGKSITKALTLPFVAIGAYSTKAFGDFDQAMTESLSILGDVSDEMRVRMEDTARTISMSTMTSADELARSYYYLASAGMSAEQSLASLDVVNNFAIAGTFSMTQATDLLSDALNALGMASQDAEKHKENLIRLSDVLVKTNNVANGSVQDFSEALTNMAAAALRTLNKDVEEGAAALAVFADQGTKGVKAGMALNIVLRDVQEAFKRQKQNWLDMGISIYDAQEKMKPLADIIELLENKFQGLTDAQKPVTSAMLGFQSKSFGYIQTLMGHSQKMREYEAALRGASGETKQLTDRVLKSFNAQMLILGNNIKDVARRIGEFFAPIILKVNHMIRESVAAWNSLNTEVQSTIIAVSTIAASVGPAIMAFGFLMKTIVFLKGFFTSLLFAGTSATAGIGTGALAAMAPLMALAAKVALVVGAFAGLVYLVWGKEGIVTAWNAATNAVKNFVSLSLGFFAHLRENLGILFTWLRDNWQSVLGDMGRLFVVAFQNYQDNLMVSLRTWMQLFGAFTAWMYDLFSNLFSVDFLTIIYTALSSALEKIVEWGKKIGEILKAAFTLRFDDLEKALSGAFESGFNKGVDNFDLLSVWGDILKEGTEQMKAPWEGFEPSFKMPALNLEFQKPVMEPIVSATEEILQAAPEAPLSEIVPSVIKEAETEAIESTDREAEFEQIALNRYNLAGLTGYGPPQKNVMQQVEDKGVESALQELIQITKEQQQQDVVLVD
ncbi:MAG: phage tail tape measure protein [Candidatus Methanomethylophilaceae archaeon]|jgi:TP901 family phage tail tape measure protein